MSRNLTPYHFFLKHAGYSYHPARETKAQGRVRCAQELAAAERRARAEGLECLWEVDPEITSADWIERGEDGGPDRDPWQTWCACLVGQNAAGHDTVLESLGGVDFGRDGDPHGDPYARVVAAELASNYFAALDNRNPCA